MDEFNCPSGWVLAVLRVSGTDPGATFQQNDLFAFMTEHGAVNGYFTLGTCVCCALVIFRNSWLFKMRRNTLILRITRMRPDVCLF